MRRHDDRPVTLFAAERTSPLGPLPEALLATFRDAVEAFADLVDATVEWRDADAFFPDGDPDLDWFTTTTAEHVASLGRQWVIDNMHHFHVSSQEFLTIGLNVSLEDYLLARRRRYLYVRTMDELLGENGLLLTPTVASEGWLADGRPDDTSSVHGLPPEVYSTAMQNVTGNPALTVPMGTLPTGLPFGLQLTAPHFHDYRLLDLAALVESAFPWSRVTHGYSALDTVLE
jgi:Asp-tRNA(Asn)/Glu-tRNA(Gln) amidotransferase A subunit family amidase